MKKFLFVLIIASIFINTGCNSGKPHKSEFKAVKFRNGTVVLKDKSTYSSSVAINGRLKDFVENDPNEKSLKIGPNEVKFGPDDKKF